MVSNTSSILRDVRVALAPSDDILKETRARRRRVLKIAATFPGVRDRFNSGSIAHGTANSDLDADCGVILDRRTYPDLGPDGEGDGSKEIVKEVRDHISDGFADENEDIDVQLTKRRAIQVTFNDEVDGFDPKVDLIVGLERKGGPGIWIPNLLEDDWDPSHPAEHTRLFTSGGKQLVQVRARAVRLAKGWNGQYKNPGLSSFNLESLAWECVAETMTEGEALAEIFVHGAKELAGDETDDPAEVSGPIRLLLDRDAVVSRLEKAAELMARAIDNEDDEKLARETLAELFWDHVEPPKDSKSKAAFAAAARTGEGLSVGAGGLQLDRSGRTLKVTRPYGDASSQ